MKKIAVIGGGSWATALVKILSNNAEAIHWYVRSADAVEHIKKFKRNPKYLQAAEIDLNIVQVSTDLEACIQKDSLNEPHESNIHFCLRNNSLKSEAFR
jgi:glycerol-3-phosphate dehydrogenase (NAD(P)+)